MFWIPGTRGRRVSTAVQNLDILPTMLDYLASTPDGWHGEGLSLRALAEVLASRGARSARKGTLRSVNDDRFKLIRDVGSGQAHLFDLVDDPDERTDLAADRPDPMPALETALDTWIATSDRANTATGGGAGREVEDALRALGYLK